MYPISPHRIVADGSINRRSVEEQFLFFAAQFNEIGDYNIALKTLMREQCALDSFQEFWHNRSVVFNSIPHPFNNNPRLSSTTPHIESAPGGSFILDWSILIKDNEGNAENRIIRIVPYAAGTLLWSAADRLEHEWPLSWTGSTYARLMEIPDDDGAHTLSGQCVFTSTTSAFEVGLIAMSDSLWSKWDNTEYDAKKVQICVRRHL